METYRTKVTLVNNEKTIKIPRVILTKINFAENEEVKICLKNNKIIIEKINNDCFLKSI